jgi:PAS domain-containing protein
MGIGQAAVTGLGAQFLWPQWTWWNGVSPPVGMCAAAIFGLLFARNFLSSSVRMRRADLFLLAQLGGWGLTVVAAVALPYSVSAWMVTVLAVVSVVTMVVIGVISVRRAFAGARVFFMAWAVLLLGVLTLVLHNLGILPSNALTVNSLLIGSALEMVLLSFALADRINVARRFKEQAQARIAAEHAMVEALSQSQDRLRMMLEERELILESSIVGIVFLTPDGRFRWANKAMLTSRQARADTSMEPFSFRASSTAHRRRGRFQRGAARSTKPSCRCVVGRHPDLGFVRQGREQARPQPGHRLGDRTSPSASNWKSNCKDQFGARGYPQQHAGWHRAFGRPAS